MSTPIDCASPPSRPARLTVDVALPLLTRLSAPSCDAIAIPLERLKPCAAREAFDRFRRAMLTTQVAALAVPDMQAGTEADTNVWG